MAERMVSVSTRSTPRNCSAQQLRRAVPERRIKMRKTVACARELVGGNGIPLEHHVGCFAAGAE
jgi:hypothetical protein